MGVEPGNAPVRGWDAGLWPVSRSGVPAGTRQRSDEGSSVVVRWPSLGMLHFHSRRAPWGEAVVVGDATDPSPAEARQGWGWDECQPPGLAVPTHEFAAERRPRGGTGPIPAPRAGGPCPRVHRDQQAGWRCSRGGLLPTSPPLFGGHEGDEGSYPVIPDPEFLLGAVPVQFLLGEVEVGGLLGQGVVLVDGWKPVLQGPFDGLRPGLLRGSTSSLVSFLPSPVQMLPSA